MDPQATQAIADVVVGVVKATSVYEDAVRPGAVELGKALQTTGRAVNLLLAPVRVLATVGEQVEKFLNLQLEEKLRDVPDEELITPDLRIAGLALEDLRFSLDEAELRDMYANLLADAMDRRTKDGPHPAFIGVLKQLTPDEARILKFMMNNGNTAPVLDVRLERTPPPGRRQGSSYMARNLSLLGEKALCAIPDSAPIYIDNLIRLGIAEIPPLKTLVSPTAYEELEASPHVLQFRNAAVPAEHGKVELERKVILLTVFGTRFAEVCARDHRDKVSGKPKAM